jgi:integrase
MQAKHRTRFSELVISRLNPPAQGEAIYWDSILPAFGVRVSQSGRKTWFVAIKGGKRRLGHYPDLSVAAARTAARAMMEGKMPDIRHAEPADEPHRDATTFSSLVEEFLGHGLSRQGKPLRPATARAYRVVLRTYARPLHDRPIEDIRRRDIATLIGTIARDQGTPAAALARSVLSRFWGWLLETDQAEFNVAMGTPIYALEPRARVLTDGELTAIWQATDDAGDFSTIIRLCLWTGCRRSEAGGMRWSEIENGVWTIPGSRTKNHRKAAAAIAARPRIVGKNPIFGMTSAVGYTRWDDAKARLDDRLGFGQPWRLHDLRRSVETRMTAIGISRELITRALNHGVPQLQQTYDRHDYSREVGMALQLWADALAQIVEQRQAVVTMNRQGAYP